MAYNQIDEVDLIALVALPLFAGVELGVWTLSLDTFSTGFRDVLFSLGGTDITIAMVGALFSIGGLVATGQLNGENFRDEEWYVIGGAIVALPLYRFVPAFQNLIDSYAIIAFALWLLISGAAVYISYKG